jgi:DNA-directed RNA polymerase subunit H
MTSENSTQSENYSPLFNKVYKSRETLLSILKTHREYNVRNYDDFSVSELRIMMENGELDMLVVNEVTKKKVYIKYHIETKIKQGVIYDYIEDLFELENTLGDEDELIIVTKDKLNDNIKAFLKHTYSSENKFINIINMDDYLFNILEHILVPTHTVLSTSDKEILFKKLYITEGKQLPEISRFDPVSVAIGLRPGEVVEIVRPSPTAITSLYYRYCI